MEKEILDRGYVTHALTNQNGDIYGLDQNRNINFAKNEIEKANRFYWSEVYCEKSYFAMIIRKGTLIENPTSEVLQRYLEQSKVNLN